MHAPPNSQLKMPGDARKISGSLNSFFWYSALTIVAQLVGALSHRPRGGGFHSQLGHMSGLQVLSLAWVRVRGSQSMLLSHIDVSLSVKINK